MTLASRFRYWLPLLPLLVLLGLAYWLNQQARPQPFRGNSSSRHDPDAVMENFSATKMDNQGTPDFVMTAKKMMHYPDDDSTILEEPGISMLSTEHPSLHATAKRGKISKNGDEIFLYDDVKVVRDASAHQDRLSLQTQYLHIAPAENLADTNLPVTLSDGNGSIEAIGLEMNSQTRVMKLLAHVRSEYAPTKH